MKIVFHNANSIIKREIWNSYPFDEKTTNIEDRLWGQEMIQNNFKLKYEPEASVYHYHGIHQDGHQVRLRNVVKIIEKQNKISNKDHRMTELKNWLNYLNAN